MRALKRVLLFWGILIVLGLLGFFTPSIIALLVTAIVFWIVLAFFHYRYLRQEELLQLLTMATATQAPLVSSLLVYLKDRPRDRWHQFWVAMLVFPLYYVAWHRQNSFDRKLGGVIVLLRQGVPLHIALEEVPGVASRETILATAVGETTGRLHDCLNSVPRWRLATVWLDALPRWIYPLAILLWMAVVGGFLQIFIAPKFEKIFEDFHMKLPWLTELLIEIGRSFSLVILLAMLASLLLVSMLLASSTLCWHVPVLGHFYRMQSQGRVLQMLGLLLQAGKTVPEAFQVLVELGSFAPVVHRRLWRTKNRVEQGEPLPETLRCQGLLSRNMLPLVQAAQRADNLPWALAELGDNLNRRLVRQVQRLTMIAFPLLVVAAGVIVGLFVLGYFLPLIELISKVGS